MPNHNSGQITHKNNWPCWITTVGPFELTLDIVSVGQPDGETEIGIASFVVMEQSQAFLDYIGQRLAQTILAHSPDERLILLTAETKGAHLTPWVWHHLYAQMGDRLEERIITLRKGHPKVYMQRPIVIESQEIKIPQVTYQSITSQTDDTMSMSPKDVELLWRASQTGVKPIFVDDFVGRGGTMVAVQRIFEQLKLAPPQFAAVVGSDGDLYQETFQQEKVEIKLLPQPFPLQLPTFQRSRRQLPWQVVD